MTKDRRRRERLAYAGPVRLSWEDERGQAQFAVGKFIDVSRDGLLLETLAPIARGVRILFNAEEIKLSGAATVKRVLRRGGKYILGLELAQVLDEKRLEAIRDSATAKADDPSVNEVQF